jgi:nicotinate-nucleotide--dimethylbenzimidazole phosphoribosyltransferase
MKLLEDTIKNVRPPDQAAMAKAEQRQDQLTKPRGSLGVLESLSIQIAGIKRNPLPVLKDKLIITMAADHGVVDEGVSLYPQEVTRQMVLNFLQGGAAINVLGRLAGARIVVVDMGVKGGFPPMDGLVCKMIDFGSANMCKGPAMTRAQAIDCLQSGIEVVQGELRNGLDILGVGEMGIGNTTAASAVISAITGEAPASVTGRGTGIGDEQLQRKIKVIEQALALNKPAAADGLDVLAKVGGFEIGGMAGAMLAAAAAGVPVVIDGFISGSAALVAATLCPQIKGYLIASHMSVEQGHAVCMDYLGLKPLIDLNLRLGEGSGAAIGLFICEAAVNTLTQMATFSQAGVSDKDTEK